MRVTSASEKSPAPGWFGPALDFGPLLAFFLAYKFLGIFAGTAIFMLAIAAAVLISRIKLGRVSPMLWLSAILVVGFGGLTIYFHDPKFIQLKPTIIYTLLAALLFGGLLTGRPLLKFVLEHGYKDLDEAGWMKLSRNWAWFFVAMAVTNEIIRANFGFDQWLVVKVWGVTIATLIFALANIPMLMKHGMALEKVEQQPPVPPQG
jgi:intracellular septation protein